MVTILLFHPVEMKQVCEFRVKHLIKYVDNVLKPYLHLTELLHITAWIVWKRNVFDKLCTYAKLNCFK